jgi:cytochrome c
MKKLLYTVACAALFLSAQFMFAQGKGKAGAGDAAKGKELFEANCGVCHNADTEERKMGPGLKGLFKHPMLVNGMPVNDANVTAFVNAGGNGMPGFADLLTAAEKADLIAYLKSL